MPLVRVGSLSQLPSGSVMEASAGGGTYAICNIGGEIRAVDGICPHAGGPLGQGALHGSILVCPWHAWEFDCRPQAPNSEGNLIDEVFTLASVRVEIDGDDILIDVP